MPDIHCPDSATPASFKLEVDATAFRKALATVQKCRERSDKSHPILRTVCIEGRDLSGEAGDFFTLSHRGIDLQVFAEVKGECVGSIAIPARALESFMAGADGDTLTIVRDPGDGGALLRCGEFQVTIYPLSVAEAPEFEGPAAGDTFRLIKTPEGVLSWLLALTAPFVATEETRYYLNGVCLECAGATLRAVATDGHRLGTRATDLPATAAPWGSPVIVPRVTVAAVQYLCGEREVSISTDGKRIAFVIHGEGIAIKSKLIDGTFPDWRRVIPKDSNIAVELDANRLTRFARIAAGLDANSFKGRGIKVEAVPGRGMRLSASAPGEGKAETMIPGEFPPFGHFGVNSRYLAGIAKAVGTPKLKLQLVDDSGHNPMIIRDPSGVDKGYVVLMPMRV